MSQLSDRYEEENLDATALNMRSHAIATVRYKVYVFVLVVFLVFVWPMVTAEADKLRGTGSLDKLLSLGEIPNIMTNFLSTRGEGGILNAIDEVKTNIDEVEKQIESANITTEIIASLNETGKQNTIINCLNNGFCDDIEPPLRPLLPLFRTYLLIGNLTGTKMSFNQKVILKNINDFLLKTNAGIDNADLFSVNFGNPTIVNEALSLYKIPITLGVEFAHKNMLLSFLHNVEEKVSFTIPILYKISALNYNISTYNQPQTITVSLDAYYIQNLGEVDQPSEPAS